LLDNDPLRDISNTNGINSVVLNGKVLNRETLDSILVAVKDANNASRNVDISKYLN